MNKNMKHVLNMYGFTQIRNNLYENNSIDASVRISSDHYIINTCAKILCTSDFLDIIDVCDEVTQSSDLDVFAKSIICNPSKRKQVIQAAISSRDLTKNLVRVKSSNVWAYAINIKNSDDEIGDVVTQFKDKDGGPGDIYMYYDVPVRLWRRWIGAPSKGHFFWQFIRNNFYYRKLTGDKKGKLKNAIN